MSVVIRKVTAGDVPELTALLNEIIDIGGTTAHQEFFTTERFQADFVTGDLVLSCLTAENGGRLLGFQVLEWSDPSWEGENAAPADWLFISSFVRSGATGSGIGQRLFVQSLRIARESGAQAIDATIRADNRGGLTYYSKLGFVDYDILRDVPLPDGTRVDRIRKRLDL